MNRNQDIEANLERSLGKQIAAPQLGRDFNEAVWARIAKEDALAGAGQTTLSPRALTASRWLAASNAIGVTVALAIAGYFAARELGSAGVSIDMGVSLPTLPEISATTMLGWMTQLGYVLGAGALVFGLGRTSIGRRIRAGFD